MTGAEYANLVASYISRRFESRTLKVYREIRVGKTIIGKNRCIDIFCVAEDSQKAFAIECKFQDSQGTVDEKIPYALEDLVALPMAGCIVYAGQGFSDGVRHMLAASRHAAYCFPTPGQTETTADTRELDHVLAVHFGWWDVLIEKKGRLEKSDHCLEKTDHCDGARFFNPWGIAAQPFTAVPRMLLEPRTPWPSRIDVAPQRPPQLDDATAVLTFIGHATFLIQTAAGNILTDPMYSQRAGPFNMMGPRRVRQPAVRFEDLPPISIVLLSHNHYDHCDLRTLRMLAKRFDPVVVTPLGNGALVRSSGIRQVEELDWWQDAKTVALPMSLTPARHFSARGPFDRNRALWGGFSLVAGGLRILFAGDSAYAPLFRDIRQRLGPIDLALLPIGAYEPRWFMQAVHMNPAEAVQAHLDLEPSQSVAMHYGTFQLTTEGIDEPVRALEDACRAKNIPPSQFRTLGFGDSLRLR